MKKLSFVMVLMVLAVISGLGHAGEEASANQAAIQPSTKIEQPDIVKFRYVVTSLDGKESDYDINKDGVPPWIKDILLNAKDQIAKEAIMDFAGAKEIQVEMVSVPAVHNNEKLETLFVAWKYDMANNAKRLIPFVGSMTDRQMNFYVSYDVRIVVDGKPIDKNFKVNGRSEAAIGTGTIFSKTGDRIKEASSGLFKTELDKLTKAMADALRRPS